MAAKIEPTLTTDPGLTGILQELARLEPILHRPDLKKTCAELAKMTTDDFWEVGASGRRYSKDFVLGVLEKRIAEQKADVWETSDFHCRQLAPDVYLFTYALIQNNVRRTLRSSIWQRTGEGWKCIYHQGTVVQDA
jgi:hypothetical protein